MMKALTALVSAGLALAATALLFAAPAAAKIRCKGPAQVLTGGNLHNTPYCEDLYLYKVASGS